MNEKKLADELRLAQCESTTRRHFLRDCSTGLGAIWLASQLGTEKTLANEADNAAVDDRAKNSALRFSAKAKRVIYLHMVGAPSQLELFDYKPELEKLDGKECPASFLEGNRFAFIQGIPNLMGTQYPFQQHGESGAWISDRFPNLAKHADELCFIKTMQTDQFNHGPAQLMVHTGQPRIGYPSIGSWVTWGLGTENEELPGFMVLLSGGRLPRVGNALWSGGFLPSVYQGVQCRSKGEPILNISNPENVTPDVRRHMLDTLESLNRKTYEEVGDPEILTRIAQYEMAFRMQSTVPKVADLSDEPQHVLEAYGVEPGKESFANNCLLARRLAENGVRYIQLFDWGWDSHGSAENEALNTGFARKCKSVDQPIAALLADLKSRGMLDDTLVVWGGEFGRTPMRENRGGTEQKFKGRDHCPSAFTIWMAGGGVRGGQTYGETDEIGYSAAVDPVQLRDFHATMLRLLGVDHEKFTHAFQGLNQKLTGVKKARVVEELIA